MPRVTTLPPLEVDHPRPHLHIITCNPLPPQWPNPMCHRCAAPAKSATSPSPPSDTGTLSSCFFVPPPLSYLLYCDWIWFVNLDSENITIVHMNYILVYWNYTHSSTWWTMACWPCTLTFIMLCSLTYIGYDLHFSGTLINHDTCAFSGFAMNNWCYLRVFSYCITVEYS